MSEENRYRQLALFTVIIAEVVVTPSALGGLLHWLTRNRPFQNIATVLGAFIGLLIGFYRVYLIQKNQKNHETGTK